MNSLRNKLQAWIKTLSGSRIFKLMLAIGGLVSTAYILGGLMKALTFTILAFRGLAKAFSA